VIYQDCFNFIKATFFLIFLHISFNVFQNRLRMKKILKNILIFSMLVIIALLAYLLVTDQGGATSKLEEAEERLAEIEKKCAGKTDSLENVIEELILHKRIPPFIDEHQIERLQKKGLSDPVNDLRKDLMGEPELITREGVLGGTMGFYFSEGIHVLNERWVFAYFEDGHVGGAMLLRFDILPDGSIQWKVLDELVY